MIFEIDNPRDHGYINDPSVIVHGHKIHNPFMWNHKVYHANGSSYILVAWSPSGEVCNYLYVDPLNQTGYGGQVFKVNIDGIHTDVVGPWASRASLINTFLPEEDHIVDVLLKDQGFRIGYRKTAIEQTGIRFKLSDNMGDEPYYVPIVD